MEEKMVSTTPTIEEKRFRLPNGKSISCSIQPQTFFHIHFQSPPPRRPLPPTLLLLLGESSPSSGTDLEQTTAMSGVLQKRTSTSASSLWTAQWENKLKLAYVSIHRILRIVVNEWTSEPPTNDGVSGVLWWYGDAVQQQLRRMLFIAGWMADAAALGLDRSRRRRSLSEAHCWELYFI